MRRWPRDLALVADASQTDALQGSLQAFGGGHGDRGLAHAGRTHQAEDGVRRSAAPQRRHGQVLDDAVLHALETVVGLIEHASHCGDIGYGGARTGPPGQAQSGVEVGLGNGHLGRQRREVAQPLDLLGEGGRRGLGELLALQLLQVGAALAVLFALFAKLVLKHFESLVQEHPPLLTLEAVVHPLGYLVFEGDELVFLDERLEEQEQAGLGLVALQELLLAVGADHQVGGDDVDHGLGVGDGLQGGLGFFGELRRLPHVAGELSSHRVHEGPHPRPFGRRLALQRAVADGEQRRGGLVGIDVHPLTALDEGLQGAVGQAGELHHLGQSAHRDRCRRARARR